MQAPNGVAQANPGKKANCINDVNPTIVLTVPLTQDLWSVSSRCACSRQLFARSRLHVAWTRACIPRLALVWTHDACGTRHRHGIGYMSLVCTSGDSA